MAIALKVPSLGESITQATIGAWLKKEGEPVQADEPLVEVESEKATVAVPAPAAGVLRRVLRNTGDTVAVGETIGELEEGAAAQAASPLGSGPMPGGVVPAARGNGEAERAAAPRLRRPRAAPHVRAARRREAARRRAARRSRRAPGPRRARRPRRGGSWPSTASPPRRCTAPGRAGRCARRTSCAPSDAPPRPPAARGPAPAQEPATATASASCP